MSTMHKTALPIAALALLGGALIAAPVLAQAPYPAPAVQTPVPPAPPAPGPRGVSHSLAIVDGKVVEDAYWSEKDEAQLAAKMRELDAKMASLDARLKAEEAVRSAHINAIMAEVEQKVQDASARAARAERSPERMKEITARAEASALRAKDRAQRSADQISEITARAEAQAQAGMKAAEAAQRAIEAIKPELDEMNRQLERLNREEADAPR